MHLSVLRRSVVYLAEELVACCERRLRQVFHEV